MMAIGSLLVVLGISLLVTRVAAVALVLTGMSRDAARFQARSAFTGAGFTTNESESVVGHPVRRRIVMLLMLVGNLGLVTVVSSLLISLLDLRDSDAPLLGLAVLLFGLLLLLVLAGSARVDRWMCRWIQWALARFTMLDARDYGALLHLQGEYSVTELRVGEGDWLAGRTVAATGLDMEGVRLLGIECPGGSFVGVPEADVTIHSGDRLLLYGRESRIASIDRRGVGPEGDACHQRGVDEQEARGRVERAEAGR